MELGKGLGPAAPLEALWIPARAHSDARADPQGLKKHAPGLVEAKRGGPRPSHESLLAHSPEFCPINAIAPLPPPRLSPACNLGGGRWRLLVSLATVSGPRRLGNCTRPPVSLRRGPSGHPDNCYPLKSTISPSVVTLATFVGPTILLLSAGIFALARLLSLLRPISGLREGHFSHPGRVFWHWSPSRAEAARSPSLSACSLLRGTVPLPQGAFQNASHVTPLLKTLPGFS